MLLVWLEPPYLETTTSDLDQWQKKLKDMLGIFIGEHEGE